MTKSEIEAEIKRLSARIQRHLRAAVVMAQSEMPDADMIVIATLTEIINFCDMRRKLRAPTAKEPPRVAP